MKQTRLRRVLPVWLTFSFALASLTAQTFVVDQNNGPGTNYTSIATATAAAPDGAKLLVRPGLYGEFVIQGKGLTVLCDPGVLVSNAVWSTPAFVIQNVAANQRVVLSGLRLAGGIQNGRVLDCAGAVLLDGLRLSPAPTAAFGVGDIWIRRCDQVLLRDVVATEALFWLIDSRAVFESCTIRGQVAQSVGPSNTPSSEALMIEGGFTEVVDCDLAGGGGHPASLFGWNRPAIMAHASTTPVVRILAPSTITGASAPGQPPAPAFGNGGILRLDPGVSVQSAATPAIEAGVTTQIAPMPSVLGTSGSPGGTMRGTALGPIGVPSILIVGLPGPPVAVPGITDTFWLDTAVYAFVAFGVPQPLAPLTRTVAVPNAATFRGIVFGWQSVAVTTTGLEASNPSLTLVR